MNADLALIQEFLRDPTRPLPMTASPLQRRLRGEILAIDAKLGRSLVAFDPEDYFVQGGEVLQGGVVSTMLDFALAFAALARLSSSQSVGSATLNVNFLRPTMPGRLLVAGHVVRLGSRVVFAEAHLGPDTARINATATSVMIVSDAPLPQASGG